MADKMIRCPEGHFYDPAKHGACPWCALPQDTGYEQKTRPVRPSGMDIPPPLPPPLPGASTAVPPPIASPMPPPAPIIQAAARPGATVRVGLKATDAGKTDPVVGWLVCLEGPDRGKDFRLHMEKNYIGRAPGMDVILDGDNTVSREKHGVIIFDPKRQAFWVLPGEASGLVYLNGDIVHSPTQMHADDVIEVGKTKLVLIPFCGEKYTWSEPTA
jgi:hypothetical protein